MASTEKLQKQVEVLQRQLRKAGEHLKRLASENGVLAEQVEHHTSRESQLEAQAQELNQTVTKLQTNLDQMNDKQSANDDKRVHELEEECTGSRQRIGELEAQISEMGNANSGDSLNDVVREWATQLGVGVEEGLAGPMLLQAIRAHVGSIKDSGDGDTRTDELSEEISQLRIDATNELESKQKLEASIAELENKLQSFADSEAGLVQVLDSIGDIEDIPDTVPSSMRPCLERIIQEQKALKDAAADQSRQEEKVVDLESRLRDTQTELEEVTQAREELGKDYDLLLERIGTMRDALKAKMNAESDELKRLRLEAAAAKQTLLQREGEAEQQSADAQKHTRDLDELKRALWESQENSSRLQYELRDTVDKHERQMREMKSQVSAAEDQAESDSHQNTQLEERVEMLQNELNEALNAESQWVEAREVHLVTIQNLQSALEILQESKDSDLDMAVEQLRDELRQSTTTQRSALARAEQAEARLRKIELSGATAEQCQQKIVDQGSEIERLRHEVSVLKDHLNESMRRLREESTDFNLDKRVITNLIVGFLALQHGDSKRYEVLQLMSSILQFSEEQQEKVGLIRKAGRRVPVQSSPGTPASESSTANGDTKESFSDQWISYLLRESSKTRTSASQ
ncbi:hypothetical protein LPJ58_003866 [Coemansia sp. RSA 1591]|nr:hypothetical protein LPJ58_003866 [Coemansia sp. RSA 1591]KAJ1759355.1 hypothetical protein LPJ69_003783 [Coemansia sp. RSA 1752]KAJ1785953.1 hypothetical protein LPJ67_003767 [Coemansia sp. RSA 1938]KAJ2447097.1 hypothetical protein IWW46_000512 [Coemansia sp. RSA 2440]